MISKSIIYNDQISSLVQLAKSGSTDFLSVASRAQFGSSAIDGNYKTSTGVSTVNGTEVNLTLIEDLNGGGASIAFIDMPDGNSNIEFVSGPSFTRPSIYHSPNGFTSNTSTYTLTGIQSLSPTQAADPNALGNFVFTVEFINGYWNYTGSSGAYRLSASGILGGGNGQFKDEDAVVSGSTMPYSYAEVVGQLHGNATGVSGSFFTTDTTKSIVNGSFIGSR